MPFLGKSPQAGNYILLDSITTSATATYNLTRNSTAYFPASARNLIVSLNGITQAPDTAYSVSGSTITFSSALTSSDVIDYILVLGDVLSIGTPADNTVGESQLSYPLTNFSSTGIDDNAVATALTISQHSGGTGASLGIGNTSPSVSSGTSALEIGDTSGESELFMLGQYQTYIQMQADGAATSGTKGKHILYVFNDGSNNITVDNRLYSPRTSSGGYNTYKYYLDSSTGTSDYAAFYTDGFERLRIDGSGKVGIGGAPTFANFEIRSSGNTNIGLYDNAGTGSTHYIATSGTNGQNLKLNADSNGTGSSALLFQVNGGTERMRIDSSGNVGIGEDSPSYKLHIKEVATNPILALQSSTTGTAFIFMGDTDDVDAARIAYDNNNNLMYFSINGNQEAMRIDTSLNVGIGTISPQNKLSVSDGDQGFEVNPNVSNEVRLNAYDRTNSLYRPMAIQAGSLIVRQSSDFGRWDADGIKFNSDTAAANALDDYEEGTWTPTLGTGTITSYEANYTKIGNVVQMQIYINGVSDTSTAANFALSLPFTSKSGARSAGSIMFRYINSGGAVTSGTDSQVTPYVSSNSSTMYLYLSRNQGGNYVTIQHNDFTNNGLDMFITLTYIAA